MSATTVPGERRRQQRRSHRPWRSHYFWFGGRRQCMRRTEDHAHCYTDVYSTGVVATVVLVMCGCALDALLTLYLLNTGAREINPLMAAFIAAGVKEFVFVKTALTGVCLLLLVIHQHYPLGGWLRVRHLTAVLAVGYAAVLLYQLGLIELIA